MSETASPSPRGSRDGARTRRYVLATFAFLALALVLTQIFLHQTSVGSPRFLLNTRLLWIATVLVVLALLILATVLGRNLIKLYFERRSGAVGSRFKTKMVTTFVVLSLLPALLLFSLAYGLINKSIEQWFGAPADQMVENSRAIARQYYDETEQRSSHFARVIAGAFQSSDALGAASAEGRGRTLARLARDFGLQGARLYDNRGAVVAEAGSIASTGDHPARAARLVRRALGGSEDFEIDRLLPRDALKEVVWAVSPVRDPSGKTAGAVLVESRIAQGVHFKAYSVIEAYDKYRELEREKKAIRFNFLLMLALSTLLIVFAFSWFAMYLAKRITVPIQALAEGAEAVAAGNLNYRVQTEAFDELENLVASFNRMTSDLEEHKSNIEAAQGRLRQTNVELDDRRRYIETILQTIQTGVLSLDSSYRVRAMNRAAAAMLEVEDLPEGFERGLDEVVHGRAASALRTLLQKAQALGSAARNIELRLPGKTLHVATMVTPLHDSQGQRTGWVLVLDDITELLAAEKMAAWQEVARRLAHEIRNPLTPIQLSAERILRRYTQISEALRPGAPPQQWSGELASFEPLLNECVRTITQEADSLKKLVDEFSRFARLPVARLEDADIHAVLEKTLSLYNGRIADVRVVTAFGSDVPRLRIDPEQMRRVFINLFDNALEAMAENAHAKILQIRTSRNGAQRSIRIEVADTGRGFPHEYQDSLFLPYFSTRKDGTGLGLAIVRQIITDHAGQVRAEPNVPLGTRIVIDLPVAQA